MQLEELLTGLKEIILEHRNLLGDLAKQNITRVTLDSRQAGAGSIFIASKGALDSSRDGHDYIKQVHTQNPACIIVEDKDYLLANGDTPTILVKNSRVAAAILNEKLNNYPSQSLEICAVTGTNGKTTTSFLNSSIMQHAGKKSAVLGTLGVGSVDRLRYFGMTTPEAEVLSPLLRGLCTEGFQHVAMEVSSHALSLHRVDGLTFKAAAFTNLSVDHLDFHGDPIRYRQAKERLFKELLPKQAYAILPEQDPLVQQLQKKKHPFLTWGYSNRADIRASESRQTEQGIVFKLTAMGQERVIQSPLFGSYNLDNILCAAGLSIACELSIEEIAQGLTQAKAPPGRMQRIQTDNFLKKPTVFVDFAHTPDALEQVLYSLKQITKERLLVVFGCGGDRDKSKRPQMGNIATSMADMTIITSDNPRTENPETIAHEILNGVLPHKKSACQIILDRKEAILKAIRSSGPQDIVLIAGKGHENMQQIGNLFYPLDDATIATSALEDWRS